MGLGSYLDLIDNDERIDESYVNAAKEYKEKFGYAVPRDMIPAAVSDSDIVLAIKECIVSNEDKLLKLLNITKRDDLLY